MKWSGGNIGKTRHCSGDFGPVASAKGIIGHATPKACRHVIVVLEGNRPRTFVRLKHFARKSAADAIATRNGRNPKCFDGAAL